MMINNMRFQGSVKKVQNRYLQQETKSWQVTIDLDEDSKKLVDEFREKFVGKESCSLHIDSDKYSIDVPFQPYDGIHRDSDSGSINKLILQFPATEEGWENWVKVTRFANQPCQFRIE